MTALTKDRNTPKRIGEVFHLPVAASKKIFAGSLVMLNATGYATPGATATGQVCAGRANEQVDNSAGADGDLFVDVEQGVFQFANSASADEITAAEIGDTCYIVDDQTVAKTDGTSTRSAAGKVVGVDADGVWVRMGL
ncbi:MAG: hypothetical protein M0Q49_02175 [Porticoccaceae bacterium]|nr:hypothetical protein [Porticoccaceae bacterium]